MSNKNMFDLLDIILLTKIDKNFNLTKILLHANERGRY